ncbi:MAG: bifunctional metallophosphatase/5'-nucleotidase [Bacteroidales bacterium]|nr:bifunctional metallophosphatase/5'-nucleotidase [Bacteroidales bacterium]
MHENDVHCALDGYVAFAGFRDAVAAADSSYVFTVSSGDFLQGGAMGTLSKGQYPADVIRKVRYDVMVPGNHEFDFGMERLMELCGTDSPMICANLFRLDPDGKVPPERIFPAYHITRAGNKRIAWIGACTPQSVYSEDYAFYDENGRKIYDLSDADLADIIQHCIYEVRAQGADYIILLSHLGDRPCKDTDMNSREIIAVTNGIDIVLDGHNHDLVDCYIHDANGKEVLLVQCGSKFSRLGKLVIMPDGKIYHQTLPVKDIPYRSPLVQACVDSIKALTDSSLNTIIGRSPYTLIADDGHGRRLIRNRETNLGDLVTDAFRAYCQADIALVNAGGIRENIPAGTIRYRDLFESLPYYNSLCKIEASGSRIRQFLEEGLKLYPAESGSFIQVSGLRYSISPKSPEKPLPAISRMEVLLADGTYAPLSDEALYSIAISNYLYQGGDAGSVFNGCRMIKQYDLSDTDVVAWYLRQDCNGLIPERYAAPQGRILPARPQANVQAADSQQAEQ